MFKKVVTYTDFNDVERTEEFYFNLTKAEVLEMQLGKEGGLSEYIKRIIDAKDVPKLISIFKELVLKAYGVKSEDGKRFIKNQDVIDAFSQTNAYSEIFMELATNSKAASAFIEGITPKGLEQYAQSSDEAK